MLVKNLFTTKKLINVAFQKQLKFYGAKAKQTSVLINKIFS